MRIHDLPRTLEVKISRLLKKNKRLSRDQPMTTIHPIKETVYEKELYDPPGEILERMMALERDIMQNVEGCSG